MKFQIISDVHTEFHADHGKWFCQNLPVLAPTLVVAGDFATRNDLTVNLSALAERFKNVIFVCGNHEYYGATKAGVNNSLVKVKKRHANFHWLENRVVEIEGQRFVGATMWFSNRFDNWFYQSQLNDFSRIQGFKKWVYKENEETLKFFKSEIQPGDVVITHHTPNHLSVPPEYKASRLNRFYVCDQAELIKEKKPSYWIHGHCHKPASYSLYDTWIQSNPFGYMGFEDTPSLEQYGKVLGN